MIPIAQRAAMPSPLKVLSIISIHSQFRSDSFASEMCSYMQGRVNLEMFSFLHLHDLS